MGLPKKNTEQAIKDFIKVHGDLYDYSLVSYQTSKTKVKIICKEHGVFEQTPNNHLNGQHCPGCRGVQKKTTKQCISDFQAVHGPLYDYSLVNYQTSKTKVKIICKEHGVFEQTPNNHLNGQHCPKCSKSNTSTGVYLIKCLVSGHTKIGISYSAFKRATDIAPVSSLEVLYWKDFGNYSTAKELEKQLHSQFKEKQVFNNRVRSGGTEFFNLSINDISDIINHLNNCT